MHKANAIAHTKGIRIVFIANAPELLSLGPLGLKTERRITRRPQRRPARSTRNSIMCLTLDLRRHRSPIEP